MSHTPGPWHVDHNGTVGHIKALVGDKTPTVCQYGTDYRGVRHSALEVEHQDDANARLIAAAPDLLAAAEKVIACGAMPRERHLCEAISELEKAVKKAKGETT